MTRLKNLFLEANSKGIVGLVRELRTAADGRKRAASILLELRRTFRIDGREYVSMRVAREKRDPFRTLVGTILSQSSTDRSANVTFRILDERVGVSPERLAAASVADIEEAIKFGGLHRQKAKAIKELAVLVLREYGGNLRAVLEKSFEEARRLLMELPKVGPKTADVTLLFVGNFPTIPVDTHVNRVSKRLGLTPQDGRYEDVRGALQSLFDKDDYMDVHLLLIALGRKYCIARRPLCSQCPVEKLCVYPEKNM